MFEELSSLSESKVLLLRDFLLRATQWIAFSELCCELCSLHNRKSSRRIVNTGFLVSIYLSFGCEHVRRHSMSNCRILRMHYNRLDDGMVASIN